MDIQLTSAREFSMWVLLGSRASRNGQDPDIWTSRHSEDTIERLARCSSSFESSKSHATYRNLAQIASHPSVHAASGSRHEPRHSLASRPSREQHFRQRTRSYSNYEHHRLAKRLGSTIICTGSLSFNHRLRVAIFPRCRHAHSAQRLQQPHIRRTGYRGAETSGHQTQEILRGRVPTTQSHGLEGYRVDG